MQKPMQNMWVKIYADDEEDANRIASDLSFKGIPTKIELTKDEAFVLGFIFAEPAKRITKAYWDDFEEQNPGIVNFIHKLIHNFNKRVALARNTNEGVKQKTIPSDSSKKEVYGEIQTYVEKHADTQITAADINNLIGSINKIFK